MHCANWKFVLIVFMLLTLALEISVAGRRRKQSRRRVQPFVHIHARMITNGIAACRSPAAETCRRCAIRMNVLRRRSRIRAPDGTVLQRVSSTPSSSAPCRTYATFNGSDMATFAYITYGEKTNYANGEIRTPHGSFDLANCGPDCHIWIRENTTQQVEEMDSIDSGEDRSLFPFMQVPLSDDLSRAAVTEVSVRVYFTPEFQAIESDVMGYISDLMDFTNTGYTNSRIPVKLKLLCAELLDIPEKTDTIHMLNDFEIAKGSVPALRNTADIAYLLTSRMSSCGRAYINTNYWTIGVSPHNCARSYYSFGHEIGHMFGAGHNAEAPNEYVPYSYGYGFLILPKGSGLRTVMAYPSRGHEMRVNYYSSSTVPFNNLATGNAHRDNVRVISMNRARQAAVGNETAVCVSTNGEWGAWSPWSCPYECGTSPLQIRTRSCDSPRPLNGGQDCIEHSMETKNERCNTGLQCDCQDNSSAKYCASWKRYRYCEETNSQYEYMVQHCEETCGFCPDVNGVWTGWTAYSTCSDPCGGGTRSRRRTCTDPPPQNNGTMCDGVAVEFKSCNTEACPEEP